MEPLLTDTSIIRTPLYYGQFTWSLRDRNPYKAYFSKTNTSIIRTPIPVPLVSVIKSQLTVVISWWYPFVISRPRVHEQDILVNWTWVCLKYFYKRMLKYQRIKVIVAFLYTLKILDGCYCFVSTYVQLSPCGHLVLTDTLIIRRATKPPAIPFTSFVSY